MKTIVLAIVGLTAGCIPEYRAPTFDQPHATLKLKRSYTRSMGTFLSEGLLVDESRAFEVTMPSSVAAAPRTDTLLIHPRPARLLVSSVFFHEEDRSYDQATWVNVPYEDTESYDCGTLEAPQTCTRSVTNFRSELRYETVYRTVQVPEASCHGELSLSPAANDVYQVNFDFVESGRCRLSCSQQQKQPNGTLAMRPCPTSAAAARPSGQGRDTSSSQQPQAEPTTTDQHR